MTFPQPNNVTNVIDFFSYVNAATNGYMGLAILMILFVVIFIRQTPYGMNRALGTSLFLVSLLSIPMSILSWISPQLLPGLFGLTALSVFLLIRS